MLVQKPPGGQDKGQTYLMTFYWKVAEKVVLGGFFISIEKGNFSLFKKIQRISWLLVLQKALEDLCLLLGIPKQNFDCGLPKVL